MPIKKGGREAIGLVCFSQSVWFVRFTMQRIRRGSLFKLHVYIGTAIVVVIVCFVVAAAAVPSVAVTDVY